MSDLRSCTRKFVTEFIELYKKHPCLWKVRSKEYNDRNRKNEAYKVLQRKLGEVERDITVDSVRNKINSLRAGFRRELRKVRRSLQSGCRPEEVHVPKLWYYDLLLFVQDQETPVSNTDEYEEGEPEVEADYTELVEPQVFEVVEDFQEESTVDISTNTLPLPGRKRKATELKNDDPKKCKDDLDDEILSFLRSRSRKSDGGDQFSVFGKIVAMKLRTLHKEARLYTEKLINDVLFEAEMGNVTRHTRIVTSYPQ